jgi:glucose/arabinose dehydrogenase
VRVTVDGAQVREEERVPLGARIRDVEQAPDGTVYILTDQDNGDVWRLKPLD